MMANSTGGEFYPQLQRPLGAAMEKVLDRTSVTYVLSFQPDVKRDGQYHKLRVELKNPARGPAWSTGPATTPRSPAPSETAMERVLGAAGQVVGRPGGGPVGALGLLAAPFRREGTTRTCRC